MRRTWILVAGVLALGVTAALAVMGVAPDSPHAWLQPIQHALSSTVDNVSRPMSPHAWL